MRDRLIELIDNKQDCGVVYEPSQMDDRKTNEAIVSNGDLADHLLANGVICPPVSVGQTVWCIYNYKEPKEFQVTIFTMSEKHYSFTIETKNGVWKHYCDKDAVGKWVFLTREQAERALAERSAK